MLTALISVVLAGQASGAANLGPIQSFQKTHPNFSAQMKVTLPGGIVLMGEIMRFSDTQFRLSLSGAGNHFGIVRNGNSAIEYDHMTKTYEEFDPFSSGRDGWQFVRFVPKVFFSEFSRDWKGAKSVTTTPTANGTQIEIETAYQVDRVFMGTSGVPSGYSQTEHHDDGDVITRYEFSNYVFGRVTPIQVDIKPTLGYVPIITEELRWPIPVGGDPMPDVLMRGDTKVPWTKVCPGSRVMLVFVQQDDPLSTQILADLEQRKDLLAAKQIPIVRIWMGSVPARYANDLSIKLESDSAKALGIAGTPVVAIVDKERIVLWLWQGYGPKLKQGCFKSLQEFLDESHRS